MKIDFFWMTDCYFIYILGLFFIVVYLILMT